MPVAEQQPFRTTNNMPYIPLSMRGGGASYGPVDNDLLEKTLKGVAYVETRGAADAYTKLGKKRASDGKQALGKYQVFETNLPSWSREVLGRELSRDEFLASPEAQEKIARAKLGESLKKHGTAEDAASVWFTGQPLAKAGGAVADYTGTSNNEYQKLFKIGMAGGPGVPTSIQNPGQVGKYIPLAMRGQSGITV